MAKAKTAAAPKAKKKVAKAAKAIAKTTPKAGKKNKAGKSKAGNAADALWKLAEHPLVAELLAVGATAAVATIAEQGLSGKGAKKNEYVHMLNGTAVSNARAILALLENHQQADGSVVIPRALRPYVGRDAIGPR